MKCISSTQQHRVTAKSASCWEDRGAPYRYRVHNYVLGHTVRIWQTDTIAMAVAEQDLLG